MKRLLLTVNVDDFLHPVHRASFVSAAKRWKCDYLELTSVKPGYVCCAAREFFLAKCDYWDQVCWMDADCLIRSDSPSIFFEASDPSRVWGVADSNTTELTIEQQAAQLQQVQIPYWSLLETIVKGGVQRQRYMDCFVNGGVVVLSPKIHRPALQMFRDLIAGQDSGLRTSAHFEQGLFNYCLHLARVPIAHMGREWNRISPPPGDRILGEYVWHFTGLDADKQKPRIGTVQWH